jgi:putative IMPACT (imprinted ancient) family translation regulator
MRLGHIAEAELVVRRSRFLAISFPAASEADVKRLLGHRRKVLRKACHHCWALRVCPIDGPTIERARDDGEVGRPGQVLLELLRGRDVEGAIVVSRIFGGVKLGVGGVARAFRDVAREALDRAIMTPDP